MWRKKEDGKLRRVYNYFGFLRTRHFKKVNVREIQQYQLCDCCGKPIICVTDGLELEGDKVKGFEISD